jgi:DnaJ-class molecular chaperone
VKINVQCGKCGGSGRINSLRGIVTCAGCAGQGIFRNVDCPKCKSSPGKVDCKARGCDKPVKPPTFDSFAEAYKCGLCRGMGSVLRHAAYPCPECSGIGLILQPKADPTKLLK